MEDALENDRFVCNHCEKVIRHERPLFCPYCGSKLDPAKDLAEQDGEIKIYKWSGIAPALIWCLTGWLILLIPAALVFGKAGVTIVSILFAVVALLLLTVSFFLN
jgi:hypothetical protein